MDNSNYPLIISFYTNDWEYPSYGDKLKKQCDDLGLDHHIVEREGTDSYLSNCRMKPAFILECMRQFKRPLLWIDVDGGILKKPEFFVDLDVDFAAKKMPPNRNREWHVGTMWFNYSDNCLFFVTKWDEITNTNKHPTDESGLQECWDLYKNNITSTDIPEDYFLIKKANNSITKNTVIFHRLSTGESKMKLKSNRKAWNKF